MTTKNYDNGDDNIMKKIIMLIMLVFTILSCSYLDGSEAARRGRVCRYNYKGEVQNCDYMN